MNPTNINESRLFVGGIRWGSTEDDLKDAFSQAGTVVSVKIIKDKRTGRSKGYAFVEMSTPEEAQQAIELFNGKPLDGRNVTVNVAKPQEQHDMQ